MAVMQSSLALASLHRCEPQSRATEYKVSALTALSASLRAGMGTKEAIQHVAAGMLLCLVEVSEQLPILIGRLGNIKFTE